jgi:hypothetical protein
MRYISKISKRRRDGEDGVSGRSFSRRNQRKMMSNNNRRSNTKVPKSKNFAKSITSQFWTFNKVISRTAV